MVILAAIALIVLVIAVILVMKGGKTLDQSTGSCTTQGGACKNFADATSSDKNIGQYDCPATQSCYRYNFGG